MKSAYAKRLKAILFCAVFLGSLFALPLQKVFAGTILIQAEYVDRGTIQLNEIRVNQGMRDDGDLSDDFDDFSIDQLNEYLDDQVVGEFVDPDIGDRQEWTRDRGGCESKIHDDGGTMKLHELRLNVSGVGCKELTPDKDWVFSQDTLENEVFPGGGNRAQIWFRWVNEATMVRVDGRDGDFRLTDENQPNSFFRVEEEGDGENQDHVDSGPTDFNRGLYRRNGDTINVMIDDATNRSRPPTDNSQNPGTVPGEEQGTDNNPVCESTGFDLSWIFCPLINGMAEAADFMFDQIIRPLLQTPGVDVDDSEDEIFQVWSAFRNIANILLVVAMIVIVFGQTIGGGLIDAYNAKKILPRILAAAILVNISLYMVALMVDITNIVAIGLSDLIYAPFSSAGEFHFNINGGTQALGVGAIVAGVFAGVAAGGAVVGLIGAAIPMFLLFVLLPAVLAFIGVVVTLIIRRGLIIFLILVSPIAFVLYCLPGTEKYFRKWWELLAKTLLVYPIIMAIFAIADVMAVTIDWGASTGGLTSTVGDLISIALLVIPLFLIPFAFKLAGGAIGSLYAAIGGFNKKGTEMIKGDIRDPNSMRNMAKSRWQGKSQGAREDIVQAGINMNRKETGFKKRFGGGLARVAGGGNYEIRRSLRNKQIKEMRQSHTDTGADNLVRGIFAKRGLDASGREGWFGLEADIDEATGFAYDRNTGQRIKEGKFSDYEVAQSRRLYGQDASTYQSALEYEIGKAGDIGEYNEMLKRNLENKKTLGLSDYSADGALIGANFSQQNAYKDGKHTKRKGTATIQQPGASLPVGYERNRRAFTRDVAQNVSNWGLGNMKEQTIKSLEEDFKWAQTVQSAGDDHDYFTKIDGTRMSADEIAATRNEATEVFNNVRATADSLDMRFQQRGDYTAQNESGEVVSGAQTGAAGHVNQAIQSLVNTARTPRPPQERPVQRGGPGNGGVILGPPGN